MFYWSHLLYVPYWVLLIVHAPAFWKWFIVPCIVFIIEKVYRTGNRWLILYNIFGEIAGFYIVFLFTAWARRANLGWQQEWSFLQGEKAHLIFSHLRGKLIILHNFCRVVSLVIKRPPHFAFKVWMSTVIIFSQNIYIVILLYYIFSRAITSSSTSRTSPHSSGTRSLFRGTKTPFGTKCDNEIINLFCLPPAPQSSQTSSLSTFASWDTGYKYRIIFIFH